MAGERKRGDREGGKLVKPQIFMRTASVFFFFSRCVDTLQCLQTEQGRQRVKQTKARSDLTHLAIDLQPIKVSVFCVCVFF